MKLKMSAKDYFDNAAETWDNRFHTSGLLCFLEELVPQFGINSGQKVLDVGTGTGVLIPHLVKAVGPFGSVTAIDFSEKMLQLCKAKYSNINNVIIQVGNIEETVLHIEFFDVIICFGMFPHLENKERALQNMHKMLKPYGKLVIAHALSSKELKAHHKEVSKHVAHSALPEKDGMIQLLKEKGFAETRIQDEPGCYLCVAQKLGRKI